MTHEDLLSWRNNANLSKRQAAEALGLSRTTFRSYEAGRYPIPRYIELAVRALSAANIHSASETFCGDIKATKATQDSNADL